MSDIDMCQKALKDQNIAGGAQTLVDYLETGNTGFKDGFKAAKDALIPAGATDSPQYQQLLTAMYCIDKQAKGDTVTGKPIIDANTHLPTLLIHVDTWKVAANMAEEALKESPDARGVQTAMANLNGVEADDKDRAVAQFNHAAKADKLPFQVSEDTSGNLKLKQLTSGGQLIDVALR